MVLRKGFRRFWKGLFAGLFFAVAASSPPSGLFAQTGMMDPYSAFGPGHLQPYLNVRNMGMGGIGTGLSGRGNMNPFNPGTYRSGVDSLSVRFDIGFNVSLNNMSQNVGGGGENDNRVSNQSIAGGLSNLEFYFPVCKWYRMGIYLLPLTDMYYQTSSFSEYEPYIGLMKLTHSGSGGLAKLGWGHSLGWGPVSAGFNLNYIFGNLKESSVLSFLDDTLAKYAGSSEIYTATKLNGFGLDVGITANPSVGPSQYFTVGASYSLKSTLYGTRTSVAEGVHSSYHDTAYVPAPGIKGKLVFPSILRVGVSYEYVTRFLVGLDFTYGWWKQYEEYGQQFDFFRNTYAVNLGMELEANPQATTVARRFSYRIGAFFNNNYPAYEEKELYSYGFSVGVGIPVRKSRSVINVGLQFGRTGSLAKGQVRENFMRIGVSFSDLETWFVKPKYD